MRGGTPQTPAGALSGGNQQKVVLAREIDRDPQGADRRAADARSRRRRDRVRPPPPRRASATPAAPFLLVSLELEEILSLSDRILVIYEGRIVGEFPPTATEEELGFAMTGGGRAEAAHERMSGNHRATRARSGGRRRLEGGTAVPAPRKLAAALPRVQSRLSGFLGPLITTVIAFLVGGLVVRSRERTRSRSTRRSGRAPASTGSSRSGATRSRCLSRTSRSGSRGTRDPSRR